VTFLLIVTVGFALDLIIGDPAWLPHPVVGMGRLTSWMEKVMLRLARTPFSRRVAGLLLVFLVVGATYLAASWLLRTLSGSAPVVAVLVEVWLVSTVLAVKSLGQAARRVKDFLQVEEIEEARRSLGWIVGRDTGNLDEPEIVRGCIETVAENTSDGVVAPIFYLFLGGVPLALAYKAVNTLDSMVGYRDEKYRDFGWAAARLDDLANFIPARLTVVFLLLAAVFFGLGASCGWRTVRQDAWKHPSPNGGYPEAAVAGSLRVRLGGTNYYQGRPARRPYLGASFPPPTVHDLDQAVRLMYLASFMAFVSGLLIRGALFGAVVAF